MTYRKITVDGKEYEYVIGKTHTKVKTVGVFKNDEIGSTNPRYVDPACECCGESMSILYPSEYPIRHDDFAVRPADIVTKIKSLVKA